MSNSYQSNCGDHHPIITQVHTHAITSSHIHASLRRKVFKCIKRTRQNYLNHGKYSSFENLGTFSDYFVEASPALYLPRSTSVQYICLFIYYPDWHMKQTTTALLLNRIHCWIIFHCSQRACLNFLSVHHT